MFGRLGAKDRVGLAILAALTIWGAYAALAADQASMDEPGDAQVNAAIKALGEEAATRGRLPGARLFAAHCSSCHLGSVERAPSIGMLGMITPEAVVAATHGVMQAQASSLTEDERPQIAEYLTGRKVGEADRFPSPQCKDDLARFDYSAPPSVLGWGFDAQAHTSFPRPPRG